MKKVITAAIIAGAMGSAAAAEVGLSGELNRATDTWGTQVSVSAGNFFGVVPTVTATYNESQFTRYSIGGSYGLFNVGPVAVDATAAYVYQYTRAAENESGLAAGLKASLPLTKDVALVGTVGRFFNHTNTATVGLSVKF